MLTCVYMDMSTYTRCSCCKILSTNTSLIQHFVWIFFLWFSDSNDSPSSSEGEKDEYYFSLSLFPSRFLSTHTYEHRHTRDYIVKTSLIVFLLLWILTLLDVQGNEFIEIRVLNFLIWFVCNAYMFSSLKTSYAWFCSTSKI